MPTAYKCPDCGSYHIQMETLEWVNDNKEGRQEVTYLCLECPFTTGDIDHLTKEAE